MSTFWIVVGLALTWRMIVVLRRRSQRDWEEMIGAPRLRRRPGSAGRAGGRTALAAKSS